MSRYGCSYAQIKSVKLSPASTYATLSEWAVEVRTSLSPPFFLVRVCLCERESYVARATDVTCAWRQVWYGTSLCAGEDWDHEHREDEKSAEWGLDGLEDDRCHRPFDGEGGGTSWGQGSSTGLSFMLSDVLSSITEDEAVSPANISLPKYTKLILTHIAHKYDHEDMQR